MAVSFDSPWYPYEKVSPGENTLKGAELIPYKILTYLLDLPDANGYVPQDNNNLPRCRLNKYLWHDGADPLNDPLPTPAQKRSMIFDPYNPDINTDADKLAHPKGYRMLWQKTRGQSILNAGTFIKCYMGRLMEMRPYVTTLGIFVDIFTNVNLETNTKTDAYARAFAMEQCVWEALNGVNISGIGTCSFYKYTHSDNGSGYLWSDQNIVGRSVHFSIDWSEGGGDTVKSYCESC